MICVEGKIIIGEYVIEEKDDDTVWISQLDGEGGAFDAKALESVIERFYLDHF